MHTSTILSSGDFEHWELVDSGPLRIDFSGFCPGYAETDRMAVVSPNQEDGVVHAPLAILSMTTAFYDVQRSRGEEFFDYPRHFALVGASDGRLCTRAEGDRPDIETVGTPWGNLDVWPETQWHTVEPSATAMLQKVYELQINHLFWPEGYLPQNREAPLSHIVRRFLRSRLKRVHLYDSDRPSVEIVVQAKVRKLVGDSLCRLPGADPNPEAFVQSPSESHRSLGVEEFLDSMNCFEVPR